METGIALKIRYYGICKAEEGSPLDDFEGVDEFRQELSKNYVSVIHGKKAGAGGGLYEFTVELLTTVSLSDVIIWLAGGIAYDLLKSGGNAFVLRPFLNAYKRIKERNQSKKWGERIDIAELRIVFQDSVLTIYKLNRTNETIESNLETILIALATNYSKLKLPPGETPYEIFIPVFEDPADNRLTRFRVLLDVDETITGLNKSHYFKFWGLRYDYPNKYRIFDVGRELLIDEKFYTQEEYWAEWKKRWEKERASRKVCPP